MRRVVILLGPPGAGKGTQAQRLSAALSLPHVATGDLFRENLAQGTDLGRRAKKYMDAGQLVPDELVLEMLFERVAKPDARGGYLLDGFPRTLAQAEALEKRLDKGTRVSVLNLRVPDSELLDRITGRRTCTQCGRVFHVKHAKPKSADKCDACGSALAQRTDDSEAVFGKRLAVYRAQTQPLEGFYAKRGLLQNVDGNRSPDDVFKDLKRSASGGEAA